MTKFEVLNQLNQNQLDTKKAYKLLFEQPRERKPRKAHWVKVRISIPESRGVTILLAVLLALPIHIGIIKWIVSRRAKQQISEQIPITPGDLIELVSLKGVLVNIHTKTNERIMLRTI
ncbi:MAG: hypothetical protein EP317_00980 [Bacillota bacterium]|nr:MAG: hypothetical protein EP317_00980 [Bacillota bacterium]